MPDYRCANCGARYYSATTLEELIKAHEASDRCDECGARLKPVKRHEEDETEPGGPEAEAEA